MIRIQQTLIVLLTLFLVTVNAKAAQQAPVKMLQDTTATLLKSIDRNRSAIRQDPKNLEALIRRIVLPHVDMTVVARSIIGRQHWMGASAKTREAFKDQLVVYVVRTYASAFSAYKGEKVKLYPYRGDLAGKRRVVIQSQVVPEKGQPINVSYRLLKRNSQWLVYDISVDGVSMVRSYKAQFAETLDQKGLSGLVDKLKQKQS